MGESTETLKLILKAQDQSAAALSGATANINRTKAAADLLKTTMKNVLIGGFAGFGATQIFSFLNKASQEFQNEQVQATKLQQVLVSTGNAAGITAEEAANLADELANLAGIDDEVATGAEAVLLTFTSIGKDVFPDALNAAADLSQMMGGDLQGAVVMVGKALQDPVRGMTALRKAGVNFSADQQTVIKNLVETGKAAEAQRLILAELNKEFGGQAAAYGKTIAGQKQRLDNASGNLMSAIGQDYERSLSPLRENLIGIFTDILPFIQAGPKSLGLGLEAELYKFGNTFEQNIRYIVTVIGNYIKAIFTEVQIFLVKAINQAIDIARKIPFLNDKMKNVQNLAVPEKFSASDANAEAQKAGWKQIADYNKEIDKTLKDRLGELIKQNKTQVQTIKTLKAPLDEIAKTTRGEGGFSKGAGKFGDRFTPSASPTGTGSEDQFGAALTQSGGALGIFTQSLSKAGGQVAQYGPQIVGLISSFGWLGAIVAAIIIVLDSLMTTIGPVLNDVLAPIFNYLAGLGRVIGEVISPLLAALAPIIGFLMDVLTVLTNVVLVPIVTVLVVIFRAFQNLIIAIENLMIWLGNLVELDDKKKKGYKAYVDIGAPISAIQTTGESTVNRTAATTGQGASYTAGKTLNITVNYQDQVVVVGNNNSGLEALARLIRGEILKLDQLGV